MAVSANTHPQLAPRDRWLIGSVIVGCFALAVSNAFVLDDAFISFRYARNLVETGELTWNPGEAVPVEGYTNFLWTVLLAGALALGFEPVMMSQVFGLLAFLGTLLVTAHLGIGVLGSPRRAAIAVGLLGTNYTFNCFATGGLETQLQAFLVTSCAAVAWGIVQSVEKSPGAGRFLALSVLVAAVILTRLDSALPCSILFAWVWIDLLRKRLSMPLLGVRALASAGPALLLLGPWLVWKLAYYGEILPNTYHLKVLGVSWPTVEQGLGYVTTFVISYQLLPCGVLAMVWARKLWRRDDLRMMTGIVLGWCVYLVRVGGDFMEFRMMVPVLPLMFLVFIYLIFELRERWARGLLFALVVFGSGLHAVNFTDGGDIDTIATQRGYIENDWDNWPGVGNVLGDLFGGAADPVTIATTAAGAVPYTSQLRTVDMLGLNDLWVARHGSSGGTRTGHTRRADLPYLLRRHVHLVLGHPRVDRLSGPTAGEATFPMHRLQGFELGNVEPEVVPDSARVLEIPIDATYGVQILYLMPHPRVDEVIEQHSLRTWRLDRGS